MASLEEHLKKLDEYLLSGDTDLANRERKFIDQHNERGWSDDDTWSLDFTISKFVLPRLERLKEIKNGFPACFSKEEEWDELIDQMIYFHKCVVEQFSDDLKVDLDLYEKGRKAFMDYYGNLWW